MRGPWLSFDPGQITPTEWAYLAGLFDGEGTIAYDGKRGRVILILYNTNVEVIQWVCARFAGGIYERKVAYERYLRSYLWQSMGLLNTQAVLRGMLPYLIIKRERALVALARLHRRLSIR